MDYHPYDSRISGETDITKRNIFRIENATKDKEIIKFAMISDTQGWYDDTEDAVKALNARGDIDFVIHGGDQSDFGVTKEFIWMRNRFQKLNVPYLCVIGNHDCVGSGPDVYRTIYGDENFSFIAGRYKFVCLNTNAMEYDYSHPVPDFTYLKNELLNIPDSVDRTVIAMHVKPLDFQFNNNVANVFQEYLHRFPGVQFCIYGHNHVIAKDDVFNDGIIYYGCPSINKRTYLLFTLKPDGYDYKIVEY